VHAIKRFLSNNASCLDQQTLKSWGQGPESESLKLDGINFIFWNLLFNYGFRNVLRGLTNRLNMKTKTKNKIIPKHRTMRSRKMSNVNNCSLLLFKYIKTTYLIKIRPHKFYKLVQPINLDKNHKQKQYFIS
jgi:hypothetical protein